MWNTTYTLKKISGFIKTLQIKLLPLSVAKLFTYEASPISSIAPFGKEVSAVIKCSILPPDN